MIAPLPDNEDARLEVLHRYDILDTAPEAAFDDFTRLAAHICGAPMAVISLVEEDRQWFKAKVGLNACQTSRDVSFCAHALLQSDVFIIPDAAADPRFADNPLVTGDLSVRFYAGAPLISPDGQALGALCVIDQTPRTLTAAQQDALQALARQVVAQLELRRSLAERAAAERALRESQAVNAALLEASLDGIITMDAQERVVEWNPAAEKMFGYSRPEALGLCLSDLIIPEPLREAHRRGMAHFLATGEEPVINQRVEVLALRADGTQFPAELTALPIRLDARFLFTAYVRDISEGKAAEAARLRATSILQAQQEAAIDGILVVDEAQRVVSYNQRFRELWRIPDVSADEGDEDPFLVHALAQMRDPDEFVGKVGYLYAHPQEHSRDELHLKDGRVFDRYSGPATGEDGCHYGRVWYFRDVTERRRMEEALRQANDELEMHVHERTMQLARAEEDYRSLFENAVDGIFQTRPDGSYLRANPALAALYGYASAEELMAELRATNLYVEPGRRAEFARLMREHDAVSEFESAVRRKDGTTIWISESSRAIRDEQGDIVRYEGMVVGITERRQAEEALSQSEARYRGLVDHSPEGVIVYCDSRFVYANAAALVLFGASRPEDLLGRPVFDVVHPDFQALARARAERSQSENTLSPLTEQKYVRLDGTVIDVESVTISVTWEGRPAGQVLIRDITERKAAEEALRESEAHLRRTNTVLQAQQEAAIDGILVVDETRRIVSFNRRFCEMWDIPAAVASQSDDTPVLARVVEQVQETDEFLRKVEYLYAHPNESSHDELHLTNGRVFDRYSGPVSSEAGQDYGRIWYFRDITERKAAEEAIRASHEMLQSIMNSIPQRIFWKDFHSVYQGGNRNFARAAGLTRSEDIIGKTDYDFSWERETAERFRAVDRRVMDSDTPELHLVESARQVGGEQTWAETNKIPLHDAEGHVIGLLGTYEDITERRQAEEALRASEERLRTVVAGSPLILFAVDAGGIFTFSDGRGLNALGQTPGQVVGQSIFEVYGDHDGLLSTIYRVLAGETVSSVLEIGGTVFETLLSPQYDEVGSVSGAIGVSLDVTERQWAESEIMKLNAQLEQRLDRIVLLNRELSQAYDATIEGWSRALDLRDKETEGHSQRVTDLTLRLAQAFGFSPDELIHLRRGALLHDIGKMGIPDAILLKPGPLMEDERALMQRHPDYAREMLCPIEFLRPALEIPYGHHEKWDGTGYPQGLAGREIPLPARLFAAVDVWDALRSNRPYRNAWTWERTRDHIASLAGTHFDPQVVRVFLEIVIAETQAEECPLLAA